MLNVIITGAYPTIGLAVKWDSIFNEANLVWFAGIPFILMLIAGIKLQLQALPKLELVFIPNQEPYKIVHGTYTDPRDGNTILERVSYRVGVRTSGNRALRGIKVQLFRSNPSNAFTPIDLKRWQSEHNDPPTFTVNPGKEPSVFVDIVNFPSYSDKNEATEITFCYHPFNVPNSVPVDRYVLTLQIQGDVLPVNADFIVDVDSDNNLQFYPVLTKSLYSKLSDWISLSRVSLNKYGFSRLLNRHSSSSK